MSQWKAALRSVIRRPAAAITTVAVMSLGIGANSALFSIVDTVVLKPLPYPQPDRIVQMLDGNPAKSERESLISPARLEDWNRLSHAFEAISGSYAENVTDTSMTEPERLAGRRVAPRFFSVFGTKALAGRTFLTEEEVSGGPAAAVISERVWTRRYQRDPSAIGKRLALSGTAYTIVGVMPKEFAAPSIDVWLPAQLSPELMRMRDARFLGGVGRMKNGMTLAQARADMRRVSAELGKEFPKTDAGWLPLVSDYKEERIGTNGRVLSVMFASAVLLLFILCANVAGLLLGHFQRREREFAIRASLGAGNSQIAAVVLREVAILAAASGVMGLAIAYEGSRWLAAVVVELPRVQELRFDWRVTVFTVASTAVTAVVFGLVPTVQAMRRDLNGVLAGGGRSQIGGRRRVQQVLVGTQFAVTLVLLVGAGLLLRSYYNLTRVDPGFRVDNVITFHVGAEWGEDRTKIGMIQQQLISDLAQTRGVEAAGITNFLPASGATLREQVSVEGLAESGDRGKITVGTRMVSAGYFRALHMPVLKGSTCPEFSPDQKRPPTAVVNRRFVEAAGGADLIGRSLSFSSMHGKPLRIVGVVGNAKEDALNAMEVPYLYACTWAGAWPDPEYVVGVSSDPGEVMRAIPQMVRRIAPGRALFGMRTLSEHLTESLDKPRLNAGVLAVFAASALLSAAVGLYGLVTLIVVARTREIGVRMAVGATPAQVVRQVLGEALRPLGVAILIGGALAFAAVRALQSVLFGVAPGDLTTFVFVCGVLLSVAAIAALVPGRRAARIDPVEALRAE